MRSATLIGIFLILGGFFMTTITDHYNVPVLRHRYVDGVLVAYESQEITVRRPHSMTGWITVALGTLTIIVSKKLNST